MSTYTGRKRARTTPRSVRTSEGLARFFISAGGVGTIIAVSLIFVFLLYVVFPLFVGGDIEEKEALKAVQVNDVLATGADELELTGWLLRRDGTVKTFRLDTGEILGEKKLFTDKELTAWSFFPDGPEIALGFADGTVCRGRIDFSSTFLEDEDVPADLKGLSPGDIARLRDGMLIVTPEGQYRFQGLAADLTEPIKVSDGRIAHLDYSITPGGAHAFAVLTEKRDGDEAVWELSVAVEEEYTDMMTGEDSRRLSATPLPFDPPGGRGLPRWVLLNGGRTHLFLVWQDGFLQRYDVREEGGEFRVAETVQLVENATLTSVGFMIGKSTIMVGDSTGGLGAWFVTKPDGAGTVDGGVLQHAHALEGPDAAVTALGPSTRSRLLAVGYENGELRVFQVTTELTVAATGPGAAPLRAVALYPKENGVIAATPDGVRQWTLDPAYPEATWGSLFGKVWYEGYAEPNYEWQSTGGTDDFEPKFSLTPLIFGTLKATLYSILIAAPIAFLAAVFTSEFMAPRLRTGVKSAIEMMASLPSVVLGFLAALIIAPFVQDVVPAMLVSFVTIPVCVLLGARAWQMLPTRTAVRLAGAPRFLAVVAVFPIAIAIAAWLGPIVERHWFGGNVRLWLDGGPGGPVGGWLVILLPVSALIVVIAFYYLVSPWLRAASTPWTRSQCALADLAKIGAMTILTLFLAWALASLLGSGFDPRGGVLDTYAQRNALIVGFVMGFAVVPIIYTLAEDALSSVPKALREGSLGAGATPWQTAWRIVIPTAMSGLFGALMVGLGRAVGETMIVLMAAGNTPIMDWNMFNGFRTLSANIAVELPEAVKDDTHYRALFLAALVLFAITFLINTFAEGVRRVFRRRFADL